MSTEHRRTDGGRLLLRWMAEGFLAALLIGACVAVAGPVDRHRPQFAFDRLVDVPAGWRAAASLPAWLPPDAAELLVGVDGNGRAIALDFDTAVTGDPGCTPARHNAAAMLLSARSGGGARQLCGGWTVLHRAAHIHAWVAPPPISARRPHLASGREAGPAVGNRARLSALLDLRDHLRR